MHVVRIVYDSNDRIIGIKVVINPRLLTSTSRDLLYWNRHFVIPMFQKRAREVALAVTSFN